MQQRTDLREALARLTCIAKCWLKLEGFASSKAGVQLGGWLDDRYTHTPQLRQTFWMT